MSVDIVKISKGIKGLTQDSRAVRNGFLFAAFPGHQVDGRDYIVSAIMNGASYVLAPTGTGLPADATDVQMIAVDNPRLMFAKLAAEFYGAQPDHIVAVTGTNGKTSVAHFLKQLWKMAGHRASSIGTLSGAMTTPDAAALQANLSDLAAAGVTHVAMEASSHGLDQYRLDGAKITAAGFTNLSRDHLDYHGDMDEYLAAKARLFTDVLDDNGVSVLNADVPEFDLLKGDASHGVLSYGFAGEDIALQSIISTPHGQDIEVKIFGQGVSFSLPLVGRFQAMNALCAFGLASVHDLDNLSVYIDGLSKLTGVPGRLQYVGGHPNNAAVYVDYAHTPDALETVLKSLRPHTAGRLVCVFGCGGDRDKGKRQIMGRVAYEFADDVIVTNDNPRSENPDSIRDEIMAGVSKEKAIIKNIGDRRKAIATAVDMLGDGDVLLVAGKGHEQGQIFADRTEEFDDVYEVEQAIKRLNKDK